MNKKQAFEQNLSFHMFLKSHMRIIWSLIIFFELELEHLTSETDKILNLEIRLSDFHVNV